MVNVRSELGCSTAATTEMNRVKGLKDTCLGKFKECKQAQDGAVEFTATCPTKVLTNQDTILYLPITY